MFGTLFISSLQIVSAQQSQPQAGPPDIFLPSVWRENGSIGIRLSEDVDQTGSRPRSHRNTEMFFRIKAGTNPEWVSDRLVPEGAQGLDDVRRTVAGLRELQQRIRRRSKAKVSDREARSAIEEGRL
jgi:hypothetical protein